MSHFDGFTYAPAPMGSQGRALKEGWERGIPESIWPQAMLTAIRQDIRALACRRVLNTIQAWRETASRGVDAASQLEALKYLEELGEALFPEPENPEELTRSLRPSKGLVLEDGLVFAPARDEPTVDSWQLPPKPTLRRKSGEAPAGPTRGPQPPPSRPPPPPPATSAGGHQPHPITGVSSPPEEGFQEDEKPTHALVRPAPHSPPRSEFDDPLAAMPELPWAPPALPPGVLREDSNPTHHIALPGAILKRRLESAEKALFGPSGPQNDKSRARSATPPVLPPIDDLDLATNSGSVGPPQTSTPRATRRRAAMHHVRTLYGILLPFARELVPLAYERRSRRFWARWREVAGDRGVRRSFVEELLKTASDPQVIVCELIAEVQSVDVTSVYALADRLERKGHAQTEAYGVNGPDRLEDMRGRGASRRHLSPDAFEIEEEEPR